MNPTPYVEHPPLSAILNRVTLFGRYAAMSILGFILLSVFGGWFIPLGIAMIALNAVSAISVMVSRYRAEWVSLLPLIGVNLIAAILLIPLSSGVSIILLIVASIVGVERFIHLTNVAKILRKLPKN